MGTKEAVEFFKQFNKLRELGLSNDYLEAQMEVVKAMEKQVPKKPIPTARKYAKCPSCNECFDCDIDYGFRVYGFKYCPFCGQKILLEEEK